MSHQQKTPIYAAQDDVQTATHSVRHYATPLDILLVEDNFGDELLTRRAIETLDIPHVVHALNNGKDVLPYLWRCGQQKSHAIPDVVMLDLGMPGVDGLDVMQELSQAPGFIRAIPIIVLTGYQDFKNVCKTYDLCFLAYLAKPCDPDAVREMLTSMRYNGSFL